MYNVHALVVYDIHVLCFVLAAQRSLLYYSLKKVVHLIIAVTPFKQCALVTVVEIRIFPNYGSPNPYIFNHLPKFSTSPTHIGNGLN